MADIKFTKMNGLGNDFVVLEYDEFLRSNMSAEDLAKKLCDRHFSIGADGLIIINPNTAQTDIGWLFYNSDGSIAQMCGNGMRCFAKYVYDNKLITKKEFSVETKAGTIIPQIINENNINVNMSKPILEPEQIPFNGEKNIGFDIEAKDRVFQASAVSMGNPHCVIIVDEDTKKLASEYGPSLEAHKLFPKKTNVEFIKVLSRNEINLDVYERGCGITLACGTGACAAVVAGILQDQLDSPVKVNLPGGVLNISWDGKLNNTNHDVFMSGDAQYSFIGIVTV